MIESFRRHTILMQIKSYFEIIADLIYPPECIGCGAGKDVHELICKRCAASMIRIDDYSCWKCAAPVLTDELCLSCASSDLPFEKIYSVFEYGGIVAQTLKRAKYQKDTTALYALFLWSRHQLRDIISSLLLNEKALLTWVPMEHRAAGKRGFDPPRLLLHWLRFTPKTIIEKMPSDVKQASLSFKEREVHVENLFKLLDYEAIKGRTVVLFDDVITTKSTVKVMSKMLKEGGAAKVYVVSLARTPSAGF